MNHSDFSKIINNASKQGILSFIMLCVFLGPWLLASLNAWPETDNYAYASGMRDLNFFAACKQIYLEWSGRYSANAIISAGLLYMGETPERYSGVIFLLNAGCFLLFYLSFRLLFPLKSSLLATSLTAWLFACLPDTADGLFWLMGIGSYTLGAALLFFLAAFWFRFPERYVLLSVVPPALIFIINGFSEAIWISSGMLIVLLLFSYNWDGRQLPPNYMLLVWAAAFVISVLVSALSPGNFIRMTMSDVYPSINFEQIHRNLAPVIEHFLKILNAFVLNPLVLAGSTLFLIIFSEKSQSTSRRLKTYAMLSSAFVVLFLQIFFIAMAKPIKGFSGRMEVLFFLSFSLFWILGLKEFSGLNSVKNLISNLSEKIKQGAYLILILLIFVFPQSNYFICIKTLYSGEAKAYYEASKQRHETILNHQSDTIVLFPLNPKPKLLHTLDLSTDFEAWQNLAYEKWYNKAVAIESAETEQVKK